MRLVEGIATVEDLDVFLGDLGRIGSEYGCTVQAFDARYVVDRAHLRRALDRADRALARGENVARDRSVEVLLYAAGRRQIDESLTMGVSEGETPVVVLVAGEGDDRTATDGSVAAGDGTTDPDESAAAAAVADLLDPGETLGAYDESRVRAFFEVGDAELAATDAALADLVHERVALLDVSK
jgi:KEOPS complex subunit Cgi121